MIYHFSKLAVGEFCKHLTLNEVACKCNYPECRSVFLEGLTISAFSKLRSAVGRPLTINSGNRCARHNFDVGGEICSRHITGQALDISCEGIDLNYLAIEAKKAGFTFIKIYKSWIHVDTR
jgi:hypothetical protein